MTIKLLKQVPVAALLLVVAVPATGGDCEALTHRALREHQDGRYSVAASLYLEAVETADPGSPGQTCVVSAIRELGKLCRGEPDPSRERIDCLEAALAAGDRFGLDDQAQYDVMNLVAIERFDKQRYEEAYALWSRVLSVADEKDPSGLEGSMVIHRMAKCRLELADHEDAEQLFMDALRRQIRVAGPDDLLALNTASDLADLYERVGKFDQAEHYLADLIRRNTRLFGPSSPGVKSLTERYRRVVKMQKLLGESSDPE